MYSCVTCETARVGRLGKLMGVARNRTRDRAVSYGNNSYSYILSEIHS